MMRRWWRWRGLMRSMLMYYGLPGRRRRLARFYGQFVSPGALCFDIGAHLGNRIRALTDLGARVVAVEPQPDCARWLQRWYGDRPDVMLRFAAVADRPGIATLYNSLRTPTVASLSPTWMQAVRSATSFRRVTWDESLTVTVITLDQLIASHGRPAFCKIDVEGLELAVLHGLSEPLPIISFEYIPAARDQAIACVERLSTLGDYTFNRSVAESHHLQSPVWLTAAAMTDWLERLAPNDRSGDVYARSVELTGAGFGHEPAGRGHQGQTRA